LNPIGIMQGRLLPPSGDHMQSFPVDRWSEEFSLAREAGLACIEWVYRKESVSANPLSSDSGIEKIKRLIDESGTEVWSVTADYYMAERLVTPEGELRGEVLEHLGWLLRRARMVGARYVMAPFVDDSRLSTEAEVDGFVALLSAVTPMLEETGVELHMETDLCPQVWSSALARAPHPMIKVCYDIGDRASLGHDPTMEFEFLGSSMGSVHVKDRPRGGTTKPLGKGDADFSTCFRSILAAGFQGPFILQVAREEGLDEVELAVRNRRYVEQALSSAAIGS
jgi:L-ribulose-5-phosphate 3-epimerase